MRHFSRGPVQFLDRGREIHFARDADPFGGRGSSEIIAQRLVELCSTGRTRRPPLREWLLNQRASVGWLLFWGDDHRCGYAVSGFDV